MKRVLALLLVMLLLLSGCGGGAVSSGEHPPAGSSIQSTVTSGDPAGEEGDPIVPPEVNTLWQSAYLGVLEELFAEYGRYVTDDRTGLVSGVKYVCLLDMNGDGSREMVVLVDRKVRLYTCPGTEAVLLYEGEVGCRFGQTDVSYTFCLNAQGETPVLSLYHSRNEWCEEAITLVHMGSDGRVIQTELFAATDGTNDFPDREQLGSHTINGAPVEGTVYEAVRSAALDEGMEITVDWESFPVTREQLDATVNYLTHWEAADFVLPDSDTICLTEEDLAGLTARELRLARNEIYARHGRSFDTADLKAHFNPKGWYTPLYDPEEFDPVAVQTLNRCEIANLSLIMAVEDSGNYNQDAPDLKEGEVMAIAETYWGLRTGQIDGDGRLVTLSVDAPIEAGGGRYYVCRLHCLEGDDRWVTRELLYVHAQSGRTESFLEE